jgi:hypothetical protein
MFFSGFLLYFKLILIQRFINGRYMYKKAYFRVIWTFRLQNWVDI